MCDDGVIDGMQRKVKGYDMVKVIDDISNVRDDSCGCLTRGMRSGRILSKHGTGSYGTMEADRNAAIKVAESLPNKDGIEVWAYPFWQTTGYAVVRVGK